MQNPWDRLAHPRHRQLLQGADITFSEVLLPVILQNLEKQENHKSFAVLDVGCGTGFLTGILSEYVQKVVGVDPSAVSVEIAKEHTRDMHNVTIEHLCVEDFAVNHQNQFDFVLAHMTLQTIEHLAPVLKSVSIALRERGGFLFTIPHPCFWALIKDEIGQDGYCYCKVSSHENFFHLDGGEVVPVPYFHRSLAIYGSLLTSAGFVIENFIEPYPTENTMRKYKRHWFYPGFLMVLCQKKKEMEV